MAIEFDAVATTTSTGDTDWTHTVTTAGSGRILIVGVSIRSDSDQGINGVAGITYGGNNLTLQAEGEYLGGTGTLGTWLYSLVSPPTGANTAAIDIAPNYAGTVAAIVSASYTGVDQASPFGPIESNIVYTSSDNFQAVASSAEELVVAVCGSRGESAHTPHTDDTERGETNTGAGGAAVYSSFNDQGGDTSVTVGFSAQPSRAKIVLATSMRIAGSTRQRAVEYFYDIFSNKILDSQGREVPPWEIKPDSWIKVTGIFQPTSNVYTSFVKDPQLAYVETVAWSQGGGLNIKTNKGELAEILLARAAGRKTL